MVRQLLIAIITLTTIISSCDTPNKSNNKEPEKKQVRKLDPLLDTIFKVKYPNYETNEIVRKNALKDLTKIADSIAPLGYLEDIPLKVFRVQSNPHGKGAIVQFYTDRNLSSNILSDRLQFDIIGLMDEKLAQNINENKIYFIKAKKYKRLTETEVFLIVNQVYYSPHPEIKTDAIDNSMYKYQLGDFLCEVEKVTPAN